MVVIHNETDVPLTLREYQPSGRYGPEHLHVAARASAAVPPGSHLLNFSDGYYEEVHVTWGEHVLRVLRSDRLKRNQGKDIWLSVSRTWKLLFVGFSRANGRRPCVLCMSWSRLSDHTGLCQHLTDMRLKKKEEEEEERVRKDKAREEEARKKNSESPAVLAVVQSLYQNYTAPDHHRHHHHHHHVQPHHHHHHHVQPHHHHHHHHSHH